MTREARAASDRGRLPGTSGSWKGSGGARESILIGFLERLTGAGKGSPEGSGRMCLNIREAFRENRGGMEGTGEPPGLGISRDKQGRRVNYHVNLKRA